MPLQHEDEVPARKKDEHSARNTQTLDVAQQCLHTNSDTSSQAIQHTQLMYNYTALSFALVFASSQITKKILFQYQSA